MIGPTSLQLVFEEQLERVKEKEEKEAKKRQRLLDDFTDLLRSLKVRRNSCLMAKYLVGPLTHCCCGVL